jgi:alpha-1,3-rhamnosyltransferase
MKDFELMEEKDHINQIKDHNHPLVSIIVITYNSEKYVLETLESAKAQTYRNIELIVTDDCSRDSTVEICKKWMDRNKSFFRRTTLLTVEQNTGTVENCNRGLYAAKGEWVKYIAGDDILLDTCIYDLVDYCKVNNKCKVLFGRAYSLIDNQVKPVRREKMALVDPAKQRKMVYTGTPANDLPASATFFNMATLIELGGFDSSYDLMEDLPLWANFVDNEVRLHFLNKYITKYRIHDANTSGNRSENFKNKRLYLDVKLYIRNKLMPYCRKKGYYGMILHHLNYIFIFELIFLLGNKNNWISKMLSFFIVRNTIDKIGYRFQEKFNSD